MTKKFMPPDIRPARADPEARQARKKLEKDVHMFGWKEVAVLSVIGLTGLLLNTERDVKKAEEKHDRRHDRYARDHHSYTADDSDSDGDSDDGQRHRRSRRGSAGDAEAGRAKKRTAATTTGNKEDRQRSRRGSAGDAEGRTPADGSRGRRSMHHQNRLRYYDRQCRSHSRGGHKHRRRDGSEDEEVQRERRDGRDCSWGSEVKGEKGRRKHSR